MRGFPCAHLDRDERVRERERLGTCAGSLDDGGMRYPVERLGSFIKSIIGGIA